MSAKTSRAPSRASAPRTRPGFYIVGAVVLLGAAWYAMVAAPEVGEDLFGFSAAPKRGDESASALREPFEADARGASVSVSGVSNSASAPERQRGPELVAIPAGTFLMGTNDGEDDEKPPHTVEVAAFEMDRTEVTVGQYRHCVDAGKCRARNTATNSWFPTTDRQALWSRETCNYGKAGRESHPMNCVDWSDAEAFCSWAGKRLPTEEEWEYAARGTDGRQYPWGNGVPSGSLLNACRSECEAWFIRTFPADEEIENPKPDDVTDGYPTTAPVGAFPAGRSPFGLDDMAGNVWEWTSTRYCSYGEPYCGDSGRVGRGGAWFLLLFGPKVVSASRRMGGDPTSRAAESGFRCARSK